MSVVPCSRLDTLELTEAVTSVRATIGLAQAVALYLGAILGAGVLILPGVTASEGQVVTVPRGWTVLQAIAANFSHPVPISSPNHRRSESRSRC